MKNVTGLTISDDSRASWVECCRNTVERHCCGCGPSWFWRFIALIPMTFSRRSASFVTAFRFRQNHWSNSLTFWSQSNSIELLHLGHAEFIRWWISWSKPPSLVTVELRYLTKSDPGSSLLPDMTESLSLVCLVLRHLDIQTQSECSDSITPNLHAFQRVSSAFQVIGKSYSNLILR